MRALVFAFIFAATSTWAGEPAAPATSAAKARPAKAKAPPSDLPVLVRRLLGYRMQRHATDLGALDNAVKAGDLEAIRTHAQAIAQEPRIARPLGTTDTVNQGIPPAFFVFQDLLVQRAEALAKAAEGQELAPVRAAYEVLGSTCGQCHGVWFPAPGTP